jgi:hypothetical protein
VLLLRDVDVEEGDEDADSIPCSGEVVGVHGGGADVDRCLLSVLLSVGVFPGRRREGGGGC